MNVYGAYATVAGVCALASLLIGFGAIKTLTQITNEGMWAIAVMSLGPGAMGVVISLFICLTRRAEPVRDAERRPSPRFDDPGAYQANDR